MPKAFVPRPDTVSVGHQVFTINYLTQDEWEQQRWPDEAAGVTQDTMAFIGLRLEDGLAESKLRERLLHEITHAVWGSTNLTHLMTMEGGLPDDAEESIILVQSTMLLSVLRDNPAVVKYLTAKDR